MQQTHIQLGCDVFAESSPETTHPREILADKGRGIVPFDGSRQRISINQVPPTEAEDLNRKVRTVHGKCKFCGGVAAKLQKSRQKNHERGYSHKATLESTHSIGYTFGHRDHGSSCANPDNDQCSQGMSEPPSGSARC